MEISLDWLEVETGNGKNRYWGSLANLPPNFQSGQWFDTNSTFVNLHFVSDGYMQMKGFRIQLLCQDEPLFTVRQGKS